MTLSVAEILGDSDMAEAMSRRNFSLSEVSELDHGDAKEQCDSADPFDTMMLFEDVCSPGEMEVSMESTLKEQLQDISLQNDRLNDVSPDEAITIPFAVTGIEANDVGSLFQQFMEYDQTSTSDLEVLSYPNSSVMSPADSPRRQNDESVLGRLMCVHEKLSREVESEGELPTVHSKLLDSTSSENSSDYQLIMNIPNESKHLRTLSDIHPKENLARMADSPKFAKFKKKRLNNDPPLRITSSLPCTPGSTSPVSSEERKHMEIKLIEALALPIPKPNMKSNKTKGNDNTKKKSFTVPVAKLNMKHNKISLATPLKKKRPPPVEPIPSRLLPVVSKRQRNNLEKSKLVKDPRLESSFGNKDPRLNKADYGKNLNVIQLQSINLFEISSSTNTASETVDDVSMLDMTIDHDTTPENVIMIQHTEKSSLAVESTLQVKPLEINVSVSSTSSDICGTVIIQKDLNGNPVTPPQNCICDTVRIKGICDTVNFESDVNDTITSIHNGTCDPSVIQDGVCNNGSYGGDSGLAISSGLNEMRELCETVSPLNNDSIMQVAAEEVVTTSGLIKPNKHYRKSGVDNLFSNIGKVYSSASDHECDDDDRAYNRKRMKKSKSPKAKKCLSSNSRSKRSSSCSMPKTIHSHTELRTLSNPNSRCPSRQGSRSPSRKISRNLKKYRSRSPLSKSRCDRRFSESSYSSVDWSDGEANDISNKLIELSNPVPYDIEHERKLKFLSGGASKGMGERKNIYAGGISNSTTKGELAERFKRFGQINKITLHFRDKGDNYAFIVFEEPDDALRAIEEGNDDPKYPTLDLCFGGRRKFVGGSYVDFDGNNRYLEESDKASVNNRCESPEDDFDRLLQMAIKDTKNRVSPNRTVEKEALTPDLLMTIKKEVSPEWT